MEQPFNTKSVRFLLIDKHKDKWCAKAGGFDMQGNEKIVTLPKENITNSITKQPNRHQRQT